MSDTLGVPRRVSAKGREGVTATVAISTYRGHVWMSIMPPFTWEAIMAPATVDELIRVLRSAKDEATRQTVAVAEIRSAQDTRKAIGPPKRDRRS